MITGVSRTEARHIVWCVSLLTFLLFVFSCCQGEFENPTEETSDLTETHGSGAEREVTLEVETTPSAYVAIDGQPVGMAPIQVSLQPGTHRVEIELEGYERQSRWVTLDEDTSTHQLSIVLPRALPVTIPLPEECSSVRLSPNNVWVAAYCQRQGPTISAPGIWVKEIEGDEWTPVVLGDDFALFNSGYTSWSPDSTMLVVSSNWGPIWLFQSGNWENPYPIYDETTTRHGYPLWSPDSRYIAVSDPSPGVVLALFEPDGTRHVLLRDTDVNQPPNLDFGPTWSPEGDRIAYLSLSDLSSSSTQVWIMDVTSGERQMVFETREEIAVKPAWSPDGRSIALLQPTSEILVLNLKSRDLTRILLPDETSMVIEYVWAPDGNRLAVCRTVMGLWIILVDTEEVYLLSEVLGHPIRWTGDGESIIMKIWGEEANSIEVVSVVQSSGH